MPKNNLEEGELRLEHKARCQSLCQWAVHRLCPLPAVSDETQSWALLQGFAGDFRVLLFFKPLKFHNLGRKCCCSPSLRESHFLGFVAHLGLYFFMVLGVFLSIA